MEISIAYIFLRVFENVLLCFTISSFYPIFLPKSLLKSVILRKKEGGAFWRGALNGKDTVIRHNQTQSTKNSYNTCFTQAHDNMIKTIHASQCLSIKAKHNITKTINASQRLPIKAKHKMIKTVHASQRL